MEPAIEIPTAVVICISDPQEEPVPISEVEVEEPYLHEFNNDESISCLGCYCFLAIVLAISLLLFGPMIT